MLEAVKGFFSRQGKGEEKADLSNNAFLGLYDPNNLTEAQRNWLLEHAGETVRLPLTRNPDGSYSIGIPVDNPTSPEG
jgi:hypothetical protein